MILDILGVWGQLIPKINPDQVHGKIPGKGILMLQMSTIPLLELRYLSDKNLGFQAKFILKRSKPVCFNEKRANFRV